MVESHEIEEPTAREEEEEEKQNEEEDQVEGEEEEEEEEDEFLNNHDLIGVNGIIRAQKNEIDKKKVSVSVMSNRSVWNSSS